MKIGGGMKIEIINRRRSGEEERRLKKIIKKNIVDVLNSPIVLLMYRHTASYFPHLHAFQILYSQHRYTHGLKLLHTCNQLMQRFKIPLTNRLFFIYMIFCFYPC